MKTFIKTFSFAVALAAVFFISPTLTANAQWDGDTGDYSWGTDETYSGGWDGDSDSGYYGGWDGYDETDYSGGWDGYNPSDYPEVNWSDNSGTVGDHTTSYGWDDYGTVGDHSYTYGDENCSGCGCGGSCSSSNVGGYSNQNYSCSSCGSSYTTPSYSNPGNYSFGGSSSVVRTNPPIVYNPPVINPPVIRDNASLDVYCVGRPDNVDRGDRVTWTAYYQISGVNGTPQFDWTGTNGLDGNTAQVVKRYSSEGTKEARVRVSVGRLTETATCDVRVYNDRDYVYDYPDYPDYYYPDYPEYHPTPSYPIYPTPIQPAPMVSVNPVGSTFSGVYLSALPQTGISANMKTALFVLGLVLWSALLAYLYVRKQKNDAQFAPVAVASDESSEQISSAALTSMSKADEVSAFARSKNILLSHDAAEYLAEMNDSDAHALIEKAGANSKGEWVTLNKEKLNS